MRRPLVLVFTAALGLAACGDDDTSDEERAATFCTRLERLAENDPFAAFGERATREEIQAAFEALVARADELVASAPEDAEASAREYAGAAAALDAILAGAAYDGTQLDQRAYREEQARYAAAAARLERYLGSEC